ncbi:MAG TPA: 3-hydroxyacyl-CoA dehydrogenase NAD-binding domain-containing protein [Steroidobacteraceae bacterium]|jgi:3-hydroxyacyl-CoA dehydrogenase/enoyl-CoA hydratase/3-hydroxybutyryl-CoA epimerase|nr:3-hydroxyacyl-CoA dehydrogenase NAD-binding domain-containing protein [Steroidobacteraceae bacterium]
MSTDAARNWSLEKDADGIAWLSFDKPATSANVLSSAVLIELDSHLEALEKSPPRALIVLSAKKSGFIAGADIREFTGITDADSGYVLISRGQHVLNRLAALPCPSVAAIHGFALGGGLELALACRYRVAVGDERLSLGLPEVQLGIHPGFGGTVRSVQLIGVRAAMELMLTGRPLRADKALRLGLVDVLTSEAELRATARRVALEGRAPHRPPLLERLLSLAPLRPLVRRSLIAQVARRAPRDHYPAPYAIIDLWARYAAAGPAAYEAEARSIAQLFTTATSRNLVRMFLLQDRLKSGGGKSPVEIRHVHVVGAGVMGGDIAAWSALRGFTVTLEDRALEYIEPALKRAAELFDKRVRDPAKNAATRERLKADPGGAGVAGADVVIEAIFENLAAKQELYARLEPRMKPAALLATNTSSLMLEPLAARLARPERLVGLHFFNPVAQMPLIEIVHAERTDPVSVAVATAFARRLDKLPVPCRSAPGFMVNRVLTPYLNEAMYAAEEGVALAAIDKAAVRFGMPMGPIELADVVGLDVAAHVGEIIAQELGRPAPNLPRLAALLAAKKLGRKSGAGFYLWQDGKAVKPEASGASVPEDLTDRLILILVNECVACLRERIVEDADLVDAAVVFGTGFAPFRGGPLAYARARGTRTIVARLEELAARHGSRFAPDAGWQLLESAQKT